MKFLFLILIVIVVTGMPIGCSKPLSGTNVNKIDSEEQRIAELEETIRSQEEKIGKLQSKLVEQQEEYTQTKTKQTFLSTDEVIAMELLAIWRKTYGAVEVDYDLLKVSFLKPLGIFHFIDGRPEKSARLDLHLFLEKTGLETGTIEYYISPSFEKKIYSISGSIYSSKTQKHF